MKEELIKLSKSKGFFSSKFCYSDLDELTYYLWMCELQRWFIEEHKLSLEIMFCKDEFGVEIIDMKDTENILNESVFIKFSKYTYAQALETGLLEALKLI